jgi:RNA polymerase sigma-70 factor (ECF subfamily)
VTVLQVGDNNDSTETRLLLLRIESGDDSARDELIQRHAAAIRGSVGRRLGGRIRSRVDPSDVVQETQLDVLRRLGEFLRKRPIPFRLWVVKLAHQRLTKIERFHLATAKRSTAREVPLPDRSSLELARHLVSREPNPVVAASEQELARAVRQVLAKLTHQDREILTLRNFEQLSNSETAQVLGLPPETAKGRRINNFL